MKKTVLDIITIDQLRALREIGYVVVHQSPTYRMIKESVRHDYPEDRSQQKNWHRMVGVSIKTQTEELKEQGKIQFGHFFKEIS